jgi:large subunit ribosomal protein L10
MLVDFEKAHEGFSLKAGVLDGKALSESEIKTLAALPSLDELRAKLVGLIQAPATKIARILQEPGSQLARVVDARAKQSE